LASGGQINMSKVIQNGVIQNGCNILFLLPKLPVEFMDNQYSRLCISLPRGSEILNTKLHTAASRCRLGSLQLTGTSRSRIGFD
jgi:hypothetical protein